MLCVFVKRNKKPTQKNFSICKNTSKELENLLFSKLFSLTASVDRQVKVSFTAPDLSSEGCLILLARLNTVWTT